MPIVSQTISGAIQGQFALNNLTGRDAIKLAGVVGSSVSKYLMIPNLVTCSLNGTAGPIGNINSVVVIGLVPSSMSGFMLSKAASKRLNGRDINKLFNAISTGLVQVLMGMVLSGSAVGIAVGSGIGMFTALNDKALSKLMYATMLSKQLNGRDTIKLCDCISFGIVNHLRTSVKFTTIVTGTVAPVPPVGPVPVAGIPSVFTKIS
jgi:hypothetical protein